MVLSNSMNQQFVFPYLGKSTCILYEVFCVLSLDRHKYCSDPFKKHRRRIYSNLRVASEKLMAEYPSLSLRSGDLLCVNCLIAVKSIVLKQHLKMQGLAVFPPRNVLCQLIPPRKVATVQVTAIHLPVVLHYTR